MWANFGIVLGCSKKWGRHAGLRYRVSVVPVVEGGYEARLSIEYIGPFMERRGATPDAALAFLVGDLAEHGGDDDKQLAKEIMVARSLVERVERARPR